MSAKSNSPVIIYGAKNTIAECVIQHFPPAKDVGNYVEGFAGSASVFWTKTPHKCEVLNDLDGRVYNFWKQCRDNFEALQWQIQNTMHCRRTYEETSEILRDKEADPVKRAWAFWYQAVGSFGKKLYGGWAYSRKGGNSAYTIANRANNFRDDIRKRLKTVYIENRDILKLIDAWDAPDTFFYLDPPYINTHCGHYGGYTQDDHDALLTKLDAIQGKFLLSNYPIEVPDHWARHAIYVVGRMKRGAEVTEMLYANYDLEHRTPQLF